MFKEELYISKDYRLQEYLDLNLEINSPEKVWKKAIDMFISRIKGRYFDAIDKLSDEQIYQFGFSIMNIECLLIDTLVKFRYGPNRTKTGNYVRRYIENAQSQRFKKYEYAKENRARFRQFSEEFLINNNEKKIISEKFYDDIRCGIVHYGLTENTSRLTCNASELFTILDNGDISVDISIMNQELKIYFYRYIEELRSDKQGKLRKNFILAMNYLCNICEEI